jgi:tetratricopeptide (TPR) repeat protein
VYERALEKETALAADPVQKIELQYDLERSEEARKDVQDAERVMAAVYAANPKILGVVRATVDFDWRTGSREQAIDVLMQASHTARPDLARQLALEAAGKANDAGNYARAREITTPLLKISPYDPPVIGLVADSYAHAGDDAGLRDFYTYKLEAVQTATMTPGVKKQTVVLLRRGLIPALTRMKDYSGATQQYIAMLSAYPEDDGLIQEASLYALRRQQKDALTSFVQRTVDQSPKDSRFAAMLAQILTIFEDYPGAVQAWDRAVTLRADKQDWLAAKADLELRLGRLDAACVDYERLYVLSYKDPQWMVAEAQVRAQQGRKDDAIAALQKAWISGHTATASDEFKVADQLMRWNMLAESRSFAEQGLTLAGGALLIDDADGAMTYMKVMTRLRQTDAALAALNKSLDAASVSSNSPSIVAEQVEKQGIASVTNTEWRQKQAKQRSDTAHGSYDRAMEAMAGVVAKYYVPEEKSQFALLLQKQTVHSDRARLAGLAGLKDLEAAWRKEKLVQVTNKISPEFNKWIDLQRSRMLFSELGHTMDALAADLSPKVNRSEVRQQAAMAYRDAGDETDELRVTAALQRSNGDMGTRDRLFELLLRHNVPQLVTIAAHKNSLGDAAANYALAHAEEPVALEAVGSRGTAMEPVWKSSYRAITGLYYGDTGAGTDTAFQAVLANATIGDRIAHPLDRTQALAGDPWFYYGMRYAVFRLNGGPGDAEDYAASELEHGASSENYVNLAQAYTDAGKVDAAIAEYRHALELQPQAASVHDAIALLLWKAGRHDEAIKEWQAALMSLRKMIDRQAVPEDFFTTTETIARHAKSCGAMARLRTPLGGVLKAYLAKNDNYRSNELLHALFDASASPADGVAWMLEVSAVSKDQEQILADIDNVAWLPRTVRSSLYLKELALERAATSAKRDDASVAAIQEDLVTLYVELKDDASAKAMLAQIPEASRRTEALVVASVELAGHDGSLKSLLDAYGALPDAAQPEANALHAAADNFAKDGDQGNARLVLEYLFEWAMLRHQLTTTDYLGVAEARMKTDDLPGALDLLRRMTLLASDHGRYANYDPAAALLEKAGYPAEAIPFLRALAADEPWNAEYGVRLAEAEIKADHDVADARASLVSIAASPVTPYEVRTRAALDLRGGETASLGSKELDLLAAKTVTADSARQPYFAKARMAAGGLLDTPTTLQPKQRESLLGEALAIEPDGVDTDSIRVAIFKTHASLGQDALAMSAIQPLLVDLQGSQAHSSEDTADEAESDEPDDDSEQPAKPRFDDAERATLLAAVSDVSWRMGDMSSGVMYLRTAVLVAPKSPQHSVWQQKLAQRRVAVQRARDNQERRPLIHTALDQSVAVRPRLVAAKEAR